MTSPQSLAHLFDYRVSLNEDSEPILKPGRFQVSKQMLSWLNQGHPKSGFLAEHRVNGQWVEDSEAYTLLDKHAIDYAQKRAKSGKPAKEQDAVKTALRMLSQAVRLASSANTLTDDHIEAVLDRAEMFRDAVDSKVKA